MLEARRNLDFLPLLSAPEHLSPPSKRHLPSWVVVSLLVHGVFLALLVIANWQRERLAEPLPPPSYEVEFGEGQQQQPGSPEAPPPEMQESLVPPQPETPPEAPEPTPPQPEPMEAEAEPQPEPQPERAPVQAERQPEPPPPPEAEAELPPQPETPPRPTTRQPAAPLPGIYVQRLPEFRRAPPTSRAPPSARHLDLSTAPLVFGEILRPDSRVSVSRRVGPNWLNAFRRWLEEHMRYPIDAAMAGEEGDVTVKILVAPDGKVKGIELLRSSRSVFLNLGTQTPFRGNYLPPLGPEADPAGETVELTVHYHIIRR